MAGVHVADLEAGPLPGQTTRAERRQPALVRQAGQRVGLVHELRQLARPEELLDGGHHGSDVDQRLRRDRLDVLGRHPLPDDALHPGQAQADLVLDQLADRAQATVAQVVDVVDLEAGLAGVQLHDVVDGREDVVLGEHPLVDRQGQAQLLVRLVATDLGQVVALGVEEEVLQQRLGALAGRRLAGTQLAVDVDEGVVLPRRVVLLERHAHRLVVAVALEDLRVVPAQRLEQDRHRLLALAVDPDADGVALVDLELQPGTPARDDLAGEGVLVGHLVDLLVEVDARRAHQLRHDDALGAVDDERALVGHHGEVTHEDRLGLDLTGAVVGELRGDEQRSREGHVLVLALLDGVLGGLEPVVAEAQRHRSGEVLDRRDLLEDLLEPGRGADVLTAGVEGHLDARVPGLVADEPVERGGLQVQEVRNLEGFPDLGEGQAGGGATSSQQEVLPTADDQICHEHQTERPLLRPTCRGIWPGRSYDGRQRKEAV